VVETDGGSRLLIDTPPELRIQLISAGISDVDAVLFTHEHADHTHGIDDLRAITMKRAAPLPIYGSQGTLSGLKDRFNYIFDPSIRPLPGTAKPEATAHVVRPGESVTIGDVEVLPLEVPHGAISVLAYRIGPLGFITDAKTVPEAVREAMRGVRVLVLNALFPTEHPTHLSIPEAVREAAAIGAERTYLVHLTHRSLHADLEAELPRGVSPAFDGLTVRV
jgi:phosphoribosyl 1,2-cyclic phosphate phosphodiesterase